MKVRSSSKARLPGSSFFETTILVILKFFPYFIFILSIPLHFNLEQQQTSAITTTHQWPEDLIEIVHEPMGQTLDRMRRFSTSLSNVERTEGGTSAAAETEKVDHQEKYKRTYREVI